MTNFLKKWVARYRVHLFAWTAFIMWETVFVGLSFGDFGHPLTYLFHYSLIIGLFYFNSLITLPWIFKNRAIRLLRLPTALIFEVVFFILASYVTDVFLNHIGAFSSVIKIDLIGNYTIRTLYRCVQFLGFSTGYYYLITFTNERKRSEELERQRLHEIIQKQIAQENAVRAQNAYLMAQINPHFFFNTLDYFYHNARKISPELAEGISSLAGIMRFAISVDKAGGVIRLGDELLHVQTLIYLHSVRQTQYVNLDYDEDLEDIFFIPLVLLTLTENIFKHGMILNEKDPAVIRVFSDETNLFIETFNLVGKVNSPTKSFTGLKNIEQRIFSAYGNSALFVHEYVDDTHFRTSLKVSLEVLNGNSSFVYSSTNIDTA